LFNTCSIGSDLLLQAVWLGVSGLLGHKLGAPCYSTRHTTFPVPYAFVSTHPLCFHVACYTNIYQLHKHMTMLVPTVRFGCFFDFLMSLLRAVFELLILKLLRHGPTGARQILPVMKHHLGELWNSLGLLWLSSGSSWWRHFIIS